MRLRRDQHHPPDALGQPSLWPCSRVQAGKSKRLTHTEVRAAFAASGLELLGEYRRSTIPVLVRCKECGRESQVRLTNVRSKGSGCSWCRYDELARRYRLEDDDVDSRSALLRVRLLEPFVSTSEPIKVECVECGYQSVRRLNWNKPNKGCVRCGHRPFDFTAPSLLYLLKHSDLGALKIGVTNVGTNRLLDHEREGWQVVVQLPCTGEDAYEAEQAVLRWWREELGEEAYLSAKDVPQGGWSETVSTRGVEVEDTVALMKVVLATTALA